jgi:hypothetical protein
VAHTYSPSYFGGRDREDHGLKASSSRDSILKKPITKKGLVEWHKGKECLPSKCETLNSSPSAAKTKKTWVCKTEILPSVPVQSF